eukprot:gene40367-5517_t
MAALDLLKDGMEEEQKSDDMIAVMEAGQAVRASNPRKKNMGWCTEEDAGKPKIKAEDIEAFGFINAWLILGVPMGATPDEITKNFRKRSILWHPDRNTENPDAQKIFQCLTVAKTTLVDPQKTQDLKKAMEKACLKHGREKVMKTIPGALIETQKQLGKEAKGRMPELCAHLSAWEVEMLRDIAEADPDFLDEQAKLSFLIQKKVITEGEGENVTKTFVREGGWCEMMKPPAEGTDEEKAAANWQCWALLFPCAEGDP